MVREDFGRPKEYTPEFIENEANELVKWMDNCENIFVNKFALLRGYNYNRLAEWAKENSYFSGIYSRAKQIQEIRLNEGGLLGKYKEQMTKFVLVNHHDYKEKSQVDQKVEGTLKVSTVDYSKAE